jgi:hypothetical protein
MSIDESVQPVFDEFSGGGRCQCVVKFPTVTAKDADHDRWDQLKKGEPMQCWFAAGWRERHSGICVCGRHKKQIERQFGGIDIGDKEHSGAHDFPQ